MMARVRARLGALYPTSSRDWLRIVQRALAECEDRLPGSGHQCLLLGNRSSCDDLRRSVHANVDLGVLTWADRECSGTDGGDVTGRPAAHGLATLNQALDAARAMMAAGGVLVVPRLDLARLGGDDRPLVDTVGTALFRAGFVNPRFVPSSSGSIGVLARNSENLRPDTRPTVLSVIVPVYNECATFRELIGALLAKSIPDVDIEVIIVESNSTDGTRTAVRALVDHPRVKLIFEPAPNGKGHAVRQGLAAATGDFILIQDADLEYSLDDYEALLEPLRTYQASFVLGCRTSPDGQRGLRHFETQALASRVMNVGHVAFLGLFNLVYGQRLEDPFTMYKVFRRDCITGMVLECDRFDFDWELTAKLIRAGYRPLELPVSYRSRSFSEGKKIRLLRDPVSWIAACARYRVRPIFSVDAQCALDTSIKPAAPREPLSSTADSL